MSEPKIKILLAQNGSENPDFWKQALSAIPDTCLEFTPIENISLMENVRGGAAPDVLILDLSLHGGSVINAFLRVYDTVPSLPIIVVLETKDQALAFQLVKEGAQDCLSRGDVNGESLNRSIRFALGRQRILGELRSYSLVDELTGLYNRRGFRSLLEHQIKVAERTGRDLLLIFADVDDLKWINDHMGHHRGDLALTETAHVLKETFRETDILARWSGDEFLAALICDKDIDTEQLAERFQRTLDEHNSFREKNFNLSVSIGMALHDPHDPGSIEELLERADRQMYERKKAKKAILH